MQRVVAFAMIFIKIIEERFSWVIMWWRGDNTDKTINQVNINIQNATENAENPSSSNLQHGPDYKGKNKFENYRGGIGMHAQIMVLKKTHLRVLSDLLCDKLFNGDEPTLVDVILFSAFVLRTFMHRKVPRPLRSTMLHTSPHGSRLTTFVKEYIFYDWDDFCAMFNINGRFPKPNKCITVPPRGTGSAGRLQILDAPDKEKADTEEEKEQAAINEELEDQSEANKDTADQN